MTEKSAKPAKATRRFARQPKPEGEGNETKAPAVAPSDKSATAEKTDIAAPATPRRESKASLVTDMLTRPGGASLDELVAATGWLPHTTRAALTGLRKKGHTISKEKIDSVTRYSITASPAQS